ncbi:MAG: TIM barrel protein [Verrucomicrobiales bacterium]|nr:TIM barrel protein [Verrucomicrobiales bacterium]
MNHGSLFSRRNLIKTSLGAAAASSLPSLAGSAEEKKLRWEFCTFSKPLQDLSYDECAKVIAEVGFDGIEAPVRPEGQVVPEKVDEDLPKLIDALKKQGLSMTLLTSGINEVSDEQHTEKVLKTAAELGVKRFRMAYYKYDLNQPIFPQLADFKAKLKDLVALTDEIGIKPVYQNHSGKNYFGAPIWDLYEVFTDYDPKQLGVAFDIGHATVEGAKAWPLNFALIRPFVDTVYLKEPHWNDNKLDWGPIGEGAVDKGFFKTLKNSDFDGPISIHIEYLDRRVPEVTAAMHENFATVKKLLG